MVSGRFQGKTGVSGGFMGVSGGVFTRFLWSNGSGFEGKPTIKSTSRVTLTEGVSGRRVPHGNHFHRPDFVRSRGISTVSDGLEGNVLRGPWESTRRIYGRFMVMAWGAPWFFLRSLVGSSREHGPPQGSPDTSPENPENFRIKFENFEFQN